MDHLHRLKAFRAYNWTSELYEYAGMVATEKRLTFFLFDYVRGLRNLVKTQISILDEPIFPFEGFDEKRELLSKEEGELRTVRRIMYDNAEKRMSFLTEFTAKCAEHDLEFAVSFCMSIFRETLNKALSLASIQKKRAFTRTVIRDLIAAQKMR